METFIQAYTQQFLAFTRRRRIRVKLATGHRQALRELSDLHMTHEAACCYADKEGVMVITAL